MTGRKRRLLRDAAIVERARIVRNWEFDVKSAKHLREESCWAGATARRAPTALQEGRDHLGGRELGQR